MSDLELRELRARWIQSGAWEDLTGWARAEARCEVTTSPRTQVRWTQFTAVAFASPSRFWVRIGAGWWPRTPGGKLTALPAQVEAPFGLLALYAERAERWGQVVEILETSP